jgi:hypothetical protein
LNFPSSASQFFHWTFHLLHYCIHPALLKSLLSIFLLNFPLSTSNLSITSLNFSQAHPTFPSFH